MKRIDVLPDDVLLEIFDFYVKIPRHRGKTATEAWQLLVHVCWRWRSLVLQSPRRLNLRLYCTRNTPAKDKLDIWPALPLIVHADRVPTSDTNNIIAALRQSNRVCEVNVFLPDRELEDVLAAMQAPFPELTDLEVGSHSCVPPVIIDSFLGGSAPRLRHFNLTGVTFPGLLKLLLCAPHLVRLTISHTHHSWFISSEAMVTLLSALTSLNTLALEFESIDSPPTGRGRETPRPPPSKRSVIPALTSFNFTGDIEYLENLVTFIDTPRLNSFSITFIDEIDLQVNTPRLAQFIISTPKLGALDEAHVQFDYGIEYKSSKSDIDSLIIGFAGRKPGLQLSAIEQICTSLHPLTTVEDLYIEHRYGLHWDNGAIESTVWLELLPPYTVVKNLYLSKEFAPDIAGALQELIGSRMTTTEVLPSLQNIFVEGLEPSGPFQENIGQFVAARQLSGHPIAISLWVSANHGG